MERSKLILIGAILGGVALILFILRATVGGSGGIEINLRESLTDHLTMIELSTTASQQEGNPDTQAIAASITSTAASDYTQLAAYYESDFGAPPTEGDPEAIESLARAGENFNQVYRELVTATLQASRTNLFALQANAAHDDFAAAIEVALANHEAHLSRLAR
ncbi:MAG: hypothetical protein WD467_01775 [Candidatus Saccharimonadales bacterium]